MPASPELLFKAAFDASAPDETPGALRRFSLLCDQAAPANSSLKRRVMRFLQSNAQRCAYTGHGVKTWLRIGAQCLVRAWAHHDGRGHQTDRREPQHAQAALPRPDRAQAPRIARQRSRCVVRAEVTGPFDSRMGIEPQTLHCPRQRGSGRGASRVPLGCATSVKPPTDCPPSRDDGLSWRWSYTTTESIKHLGQLARVGLFAELVQNRNRLFLWRFAARKTRSLAPREERGFCPGGAFPRLRGGRRRRTRSAPRRACSTVMSGKAPSFSQDMDVPARFTT